MHLSDLDHDRSVDLDRDLSDLSVRRMKPSNRTRVFGDILLEITVGSFLQW